MDEENFIWTAPEDVPAEIQIDGEVTETYTGEQVADEAGNPAWWDDNYPGQITDTAASPTQDAYGLNILNAEQTAQLTRNINPAFINNFVDPNAPIAKNVANAVNKSATAQPAYVDQTGLAFDSRTGVSYPVDKASGKQLIPADVLAVTDSAAQVRLEMLGAGAKSVATPVNPGQSNLAGPPDTFIKNAAGDWVENPKYPVNISATPVATKLPYTDYRQTVAEAARLNSYSETPNPFLTEIDKAGTNIAVGTAGIARSKENIQTAQQYIVDAESYIAQNNTELANPDISAERRAELEANNAENAQIIFDSNQNITNQETYIAQTQDTIQLSEASINENAAVYRDSTSPTNSTSVDINTDPSISLVDRVRSLFSGQPTRTAAPVNVQDGQAFGTVLLDPNGSGGFVDTAGNPVNADGTPIPPVARFTTAAQDSAIQTQVGRQFAQQQAVTAAQRKISNNGDWRVRLSLAPGARYLYNVDGDPGILQPLAVTGGVIFPYTPSIEMSYKADYESYALTHSNYKGYFYKSSSVDAVNMRATFTAQDSNEANYLLAVIHFFRSVTKMFYGQDAERGAPPPLVYLTGLGQYQFNGHPCVVTSFNYNLPGDVDYIRARSPNINGTDMLTRRSRQNLPTNPISGAVSRLQNLFSGQGISYGAEINRRPPPTLGLNNPTYVPTKLEISLSLLPVQTRSQVTNQFSLQQYATGALLGGSPGTSGQGGFW